MTSTQQQVIDAIWGGTLPSAPPEHVLETNLTYGAIATQPATVRRSKVLRFRLPGGLWTRAQVFWPQAPERRVALIWHNGHGGDGWLTFGEALRRGYVVVDMAMMGYQGEVAPWNNMAIPATYTLAGGGTVAIGTHDSFASVVAAGERAMPVFLDAVFRVVTWLRDRIGITRVGIAGHSGGGWTALLAGALDDRLDIVASVHGWCPIGAPGSPNRDYEQTAPELFSQRGMDYPDYSAMIGARRQLFITGSGDNIFGPIVLGQANIDAMVTSIQATGANLAATVFTTVDHGIVVAEANYTVDQFDLTFGCPRYVAPRWTGTLAVAQDIARITNALAGLPRRGTGGTLVPVASWNGVAPTPAGWTAAYVATDLGAGNGRIDISEADYTRLYDAAQVATLPGADQTIVTAQRGAFIGR